MILKAQIYSFNSRDNKSDEQINEQEIGTNERLVYKNYKEQEHSETHENI